MDDVIKFYDEMIDKNLTVIKQIYQTIEETPDNANITLKKLESTLNNAEGRLLKFLEIRNSAVSQNIKQEFTNE